MKCVAKNGASCILRITEMLILRLRLQNEYLRFWKILKFKINVVLSSMCLVENLTKPFLTYEYLTRKQKSKCTLAKRKLLKKKIYRIVHFVLWVVTTIPNVSINWAKWTRTM